MITFLHTTQTTDTEITIDKNEFASFLNKQNLDDNFEKRIFIIATAIIFAGFLTAGVLACVFIPGAPLIGVLAITSICSFVGGIKLCDLIKSPTTSERMLSLFNDNQNRDSILIPDYCTWYSIHYQIAQLNERKRIEAQSDREISQAFKELDLLPGVLLNLTDGYIH
jgi:hypothetical protein